MAKYSDIKGFTVQTLSTDTVASGVSGGAWASGGALNTGRYGEGQGAGTMTAAIFTGGNNGSGGVTVNEYYNGTAWTEQGDTNTAHYNAGQGGTQTSSIIAGGTSNIANTEEWNGSAWTEVNDLNTGRRQFALSSNGNAEAALAFAGYAPPTGGPVGYTNLTESWNGSSWTEVADLNTSRSSVGATDASYTAALCIGGYRGPPTADRTAFVEQWNGSAWTEIADLNVEKQNVASSGSVTTALASGGGDTARVATTEFWDGSSWTEIADLSTAREQAGRGGTSTASDSIVSGGWVGSVSDLTEEFTAATVFNQITEGQLFFNSTANAFKETINDFAGATWGSGANLNTARERMGGASQGTPSAGLVCGGPSSPYGQTEEYNGTAWSEQNDLNTGRYISGGGCGTQTALVYAGGYNPAGSPQYETTNSETYNGTSWTEGNDINEGRIDCYSVGTATAGMLIGGAQASGGPGTVDSVELYDGTSWTETTNIPTVTQEMGALGLQTASLIFGGSVDSDPSTKNTTVEWDGTSWTASNNYPISVKYTTAFGSQTSGIAAGGEKIPGGGTAICNRYDGTSWTEIAELSTARTSLVGNGAASSNGLSGFVAGGYTPPGVSAATEELTVPLANKTITAS